MMFIIIYFPNVACCYRRQPRIGALKARLTVLLAPATVSTQLHRMVQSGLHVEWGNLHALLQLINPGMDCFDSALRNFRNVEVGHAEASFAWRTMCCKNYGLVESRPNLSMSIFGTLSRAIFSSFCATEFATRTGDVKCFFFQMIFQWGQHIPSQLPRAATCFDYCCGLWLAIETRLRLKGHRTRWLKDHIPLFSWETWCFCFGAIEVRMPRSIMLAAGSGKFMQIWVWKNLDLGSTSSPSQGLQ